MYFVYSSDKRPLCNNALETVSLCCVCIGQNVKIQHIFWVHIQLYFFINLRITGRFFFFLSSSLLIVRQLSIWNGYKPFFSLLYNCQLLCFWRLASSTVVEVFPQPFFSGYCSFKDDCYKLVMPNYMPYPWVASVLRFLKVIFLLSPLENSVFSKFNFSTYVSSTELKFVGLWFRSQFGLVLLCPFEFHIILSVFLICCTIDVSCHTSSVLGKGGLRLKTVFFVNCKSSSCIFCVLKYKKTLTVSYHVPFFHKIKFPYCINVHSSYCIQI
jgi:hypothetical protein